MYETLSILILGIVGLLYYVTTKKFNHWKQKGVPHPRPLPLFGNYLPYILLQKHVGLVTRDLCLKYREQPYFGTYFGTEPALVIVDPEIIRLVFTKDFYYFNSRELMDYTHKEPITQNLFFQHGDMWKTFRNHMTPLFSTAKMRKMFYLIQRCALTLEYLLEHETKLTDVIGVRDLSSRYTMDSIASCVFGIEVKTMDSDTKNNPFTKMGDVILSGSYLRGLFTVMRQMWPHIFYGLGLRTFPKEIDKFFNELITGVFQSRSYTPTQRHDFIDLLLTLKKDKYIMGDTISSHKSGESRKFKIELTDDLIIPQCVIFFAAGFETAATALSLTIYELAKNLSAQEKAQKEIDDYLKRNGNKLTDNCIVELPYLEACVLETLRLYPPLMIITREAVEDYRFPTGLQVKRGTRVHLPVYHLHHDPELFPDPEEYQPERFLPGAEHSIRPYTFFPFGEGPRTCIGMRFAKLQVLPGLVTFLKVYNVQLSPGAPKVLDLEATTFLLHPTSPLPVRVTKRPGWETRCFSHC